MSENSVIKDLMESYKDFESFNNEYNPWFKVVKSEANKEGIYKIKLKDKAEEATNKFKKLFINESGNYLLDKNVQFSWLEELLNLEKNKNLDIYKYDVSTHYGKPSHFFGNIEKATLFLCLINPNIKKVTDFKSEDGKRVISIEEYTERFCKIIGEDRDREIFSLTESVLEKELDSLIEDIQKIGEDKEFTGKELKDIAKGNCYKNCYKNRYKNCNKNCYRNLYENCCEDRYYINKYFAPLFTDVSEYFFDSFIKLIRKEDKDSKKVKGIDIISNIKKEKARFKDKIVNLESYPFRSTSPDNELSNLEDSFSTFSAYIILWRIAKFEQSKQSNGDSEKKPIFVFRGYNNHWRKKLRFALKDLVSEEKNKAYIESLEKEEFDKIFEEYFYYFSSNQSGFLSNNNIVNINKDKVRLNLYENL